MLTLRRRDFALTALGMGATAILARQSSSAQGSRDWLEKLIAVVADGRNGS